MDKESFVEFKEMIKVENESQKTETDQSNLYDYVYFFYQLDDYVQFYELAVEDLDNCKALQSGLLINDANCSGAIFILNWDQLIIVTTDHESHSELCNFPPESNPTIGLPLDKKPLFEKELETILQRFSAPGEFPTLEALLSMSKATEL